MNTLPNGIELIVKVESNSFYYFLGLIFFSILIFFLLFKLVKWLWNNRKTKKTEILNILQNLDWNNSKDTAYKITKFGNQISNERSQKLLDDLIIELEIYKYRKHSDDISEDVKAKFQIFLGVVENE